MKRAFAAAIGIVSLALASVALGGTIHCMGGPCTGSFGDDPMIGSDLEDQMRGLGGNDEMDGNDSDDLLNGGPGSDHLSEVSDDTGNDTMLGGPGSETRIEGGPGSDILRGGPGDERAGEGPMRGPILPEWRLVEMFGDEGPDKLFGGRGDDSLEGEEGRDVMSGGDGKDYIDAVNDDTTGTVDVVRCGKGFDRYSATSEDEVAPSCEKKVAPIDL